MAEEPEEVLPEDRRPAGQGVEEVRAEVPIEEQHDLAGRQHGQAYRTPRTTAISTSHTNSGIWPSVMPGQRMVKMVVDQVDGAGDASEAAHEQAETQ